MVADVVAVVFAVVSAVVDDSVGRYYTASTIQHMSLTTVLSSLLGVHCELSVCV